MTATITFTDGLTVLAETKLRTVDAVMSARTMAIVLQKLGTDRLREAGAMIRTCGWPSAT